jgi:acyl-CoA reductase-like NAD-dependent aldehyde dehydrogenase
LIPRNAPYHLGLRSITFPLAAGNTAIFKGPEAAPRCAWTIADVFREAGLPAGCLNLITHKASEGAAITEQLAAHPDVKKINFTGSTRVGRIIAASAGKNLKPVLMDPGGKNSAIVMSDTNIKNAATQCALGAFMNVSLVCGVRSDALSQPTRHV